MRLSDFNYVLPPELIARYPLAERHASRLLCLQSTENIHTQFSHIADFLSPWDLLVCNNSRVIPARLLGRKPTGGKVEVLIERIVDDKHVLAHVRASKASRKGSFFIFSDEIKFEVVERIGDLFKLYCHANLPVLTAIETIGEIPIPPYFQRSAEAIDHERYQTIYAQPKGSVAAPTAGLHFDESIFQTLREKNIDIEFVTLHVGAGTFAPIRVEDITQHQMHSEYVEVSAALCEKIKATKARGGRVIAVGTTTARSLETANLSGELNPYSGETNIFIYPGFQFKCIDALITNFHLPSSTLLMLVCALGGYEKVMAAYQEAIDKKYRFFSYGDAMLIFSNES